LSRNQHVYQRAMSVHRTDSTVVLEPMNN